MSDGLNGLPLPDSWAWTELGGITSSIQYGHTESAKADPIGPKFLRITDIQNGQVDWSTVPYCLCSEDEHNRYRLEPGDIVFARTGATTGKSFLIQNCPDAVFASYLIRLRVADIIYSKYLALFFESASYWSQITNVKKGSAQPGVNATILATLRLPLAPLNEQHRIVDAIETQFTRLDAAVSALKRTQANLKRYRASVLKAACEGRLVPTEAELAKADGRSYEPASQLLERILTERRQKWEADAWQKEIDKAKQKAAKAQRKADGRPLQRGEKLAPTEWQSLTEEVYSRHLPKNDKWKEKYKEPEPLEVSDLPELPEGWGWGTVEQFNPGHRTCAYGVLQPGPDIRGGVKLIRVGDINNGQLDLENLKRISPDIAAQYSRTKLEGNEVLISLVGAIGRTAVVPPSLRGANTARAVGVIPLTDQVLPEWVELWFRNPAKVEEMTSKAHEVARKTLNLEDVRMASVAFPSWSEQHRIVAEVERRLSIADQMEKTVESDLARAERLRQSILKRAFEGKLVPQEPNDEPALVLLERIEKERNP